MLSHCLFHVLEILYIVFCIYNDISYQMYMIVLEYCYGGNFCLLHINIMRLQLAMNFVKYLYTMVPDQLSKMNKRHTLMMSMIT